MEKLAQLKTIFFLKRNKRMIFNEDLELEENINIQQVDFYYLKKCIYNDLDGQLKRRR